MGAIQQTTSYSLTFTVLKVTIYSHLIMESPTAAGCAKWDKVKGDIFMCIARSSTTAEPAAASYHDLENDHSFSKHIYAGGLQACVIVRYQKSPVGKQLDVFSKS